MALQPIQPFQSGAYLQELGDFLDEIVRALIVHEPKGWIAVLDRYNFGKMGRAEGELFRSEFNAQLRNAQTDVARLGVANSILAWGKMQPIQGELGESTLATLALLDAEASLNPEMIEVRRIASTSKIYEMWAPHSWIIYDSYCAIGLQWLVSQAWAARGHEVHADFLRFPCPPGRANNPLPGFPLLGSRRQAMLGFLYASWLSRGIAEFLNQENDEMHWQASHVEMVAFQLGHEVEA